MHSKLVGQKQPFGEVHNSVTHQSMNGPAGIKSKPLSAKTEVPNHGKDHGPGFADKGAGAKSRAAQHCEHPFYWTGKPK